MNEPEESENGIGIKSGNLPDWEKMDGDLGPEKGTVGGGREQRARSGRLIRRVMSFHRK